MKAFVGNRDLEPLRGAHTRTLCLGRNLAPLLGERIRVGGGSIGGEGVGSMGDGVC